MNMENLVSLYNRWQEEQGLVDGWGVGEDIENPEISFRIRENTVFFKN